MYVSISIGLTLSQISFERGPCIFNKAVKGIDLGKYKTNHLVLHPISLN